MDTEQHFRQEPHTAELVADQLLEVIPRIRQVISGEVQANGGLTAAQLRVLDLVARGPRLPSDVARELRITPATTSEVVDLLVRRGLLERLDLPADRRVTLLQVTPQGAAAWTTARERTLAAIQALLAGLGIEDMGALHRGLSSLLDSMRGRAATAGRGSHAI
jgi:DNA-binding MarR family transcriptional regulator